VQSLRHHLITTSRSRPAPALPLGSFAPKWYNFNMAMRKISFANGEFYHVFNRGVDKRDIFSNQDHLDRFFLSMNVFNTPMPIGSILENSFIKEPLGSEAPKLVNIIAFCLNPNHYHFILEQVTDDGIKKFMHRVGTGYTNYYNIQKKRSGSLFQGPFRSIHVNSNEYLLHLSVYVNLNNQQSSLGSEAPKLSKSSWDEYLGKGDTGEYICKKDIVLEQFPTTEKYEKFSLSSLEDIRLRKQQEKELKDFL